MAGQYSKPKQKYLYLENLSTEALEELLCASADIPEESADEYVDAIAKIIQRREKAAPTGRLADVDMAWNELQSHYNTPEGAQLSLYPEEEFAPSFQTVQPSANKKLRALPLPRLIAAAILIFCVAVIFPAALGYENVFAMVGQWNNSLFHFALPNQASEPPIGENDMEYESLQAALTANGVTAAIVPTRMTEGFELVDVYVTKLSEQERIDYNAIYQNEERSISIYIIQRDGPATTRSYEKDGTSVEIYRAGNIDHYIYENNGRLSVTWYNDIFECSVRADISVKEAIDMIDSIYERP